MLNKQGVIASGIDKGIDNKKYLNHIAVSRLLEIVSERGIGVGGTSNEICSLRDGCE